jgi:acetyl esterase/lipase
MEAEVNQMKTKSALIFFLAGLLFLMPLVGNSQLVLAEPSDISFHPDLVYATYQFEGGTHNLLLDLYLPGNEVPRPLPVLIFVHGGGWWEGSKAECPGMTFAQNGYAVACINYRLGRPEPEACPAEFIFPVQIHDVKAAVRWLRKNAQQYGLDSDHFGALGDSSGAHLAALLGTSNGVTELSGDANPGYSDAVQAVVDWFGPIDVTQESPIVFEDDPCTTPMSYLIDTYGGESTPYFYWTFAWGTFLGGSLVDPVVLDRAAQATPLTHVDAQDPPFLIIHGEDDGMVPVSQGALLASALSNVGVEADYLLLPGVGHGYGGDGQEVSPVFLDPTLSFFDQHLKPQSSFDKVYLPLVQSGSVSTSNLIFSDDFTGGTLTNWFPNLGTWTNPGDHMRGEYTLGNAWNIHLSSGSDFVYTGTVNLLSGNAVGLVFRASQDGTSSYDVILDAVDDVFKISKRQPYQVLDSYALDVQRNHPYTIKVVANGNTIEAYLDGVKRLTTTDNTYATGNFGVILFRSTATYDDLEARSTP